MFTNNLLRGLLLTANIFILSLAQFMHALLLPYKPVEQFLNLVNLILIKLS
jgi:hypothetical protein